jgi:ubiquinone/menaquinone biosynthesis C-methylase UbiE
VSGFKSVDEQSDPDYFIRFVDELNAMPAVVELEEAAVPELRLRPGMRVLDLGCGTGEDSRRLAGLVGPTGEVVGIDASEAMLAVARARAEGTGLPVTFHLGDAMRLDLPTESFDAARCERLLLHVPDPPVALGEMVRVTRHGGRIVAMDIDVDSFVIDLPDLERGLLRRVVHGISDALAEGRIGRQLPRLFREAKLDDVAFRTALPAFPYTVARYLMPGLLAGALAGGSITAAEADAVLAAIDRAEREGGFHLAVPFYVVSGTKP